MSVVFRVVLGLLATMLCLFTIMPFFRTNAWWVRVFDFPRMQIAVAIVMLLIGYAGFGLYERTRSHRMQHSVSLQLDPENSPTPIMKMTDVAFLSLLAIALFWQCFRIYPYTFLSPHQMHTATEGDGSTTVSLLIFNVRYDNRDSDALLDLIRANDPDVVLLVEPTGWWAERLEPLSSKYPYAILQPQENHYGIVLYTRLELVDPQVRYLIDDEVPSIRTGLRLPTGDVALLFGLHPKPPGLKRPTDTEREDSDQRDAELVMIAKEVEPLEDTPVIVAGDFNDVAWSHTTRLFQRISGLLDPRIGRGLHNTYNTKSRISRFPLDHVFASDEFRLVSLEVLPNIGSDHFPVMIVLEFNPAAAAIQEEPQPNPGDQEEAQEKIQKGNDNAG